MLGFNQGTGVSLVPSLLNNQTALSLEVPVGQYRVQDESASLVKLANVKSPLDAPTTIKITNTRIADVYQTLAKNAVPIAQRAANPSGQAIFVETNVLASGSGNILVPCQARIELKLPNSADLDDLSVQNLTHLALYHLMHPTTYQFRVTEMMRGILTLAI